MARYQRGTITLRERANGPSVWQFRWLEDGQARSELLGSVEALPTRADAERASERLRMQINSQHPASFHCVTVRGLVDRYLEYAGKRVRRHTLQVYGSLLNNHVLPHFGSTLIKDIRPMALDSWFESYSASTPVKAHIRGLLHHVFKVAMRWELLDRNPVDLIGPVTSKRLKTPRLLSPTEIRAVGSNCRNPIERCG